MHISKELIRSFLETRFRANVIPFCIASVSFLAGIFIINRVVTLIKNSVYNKYDSIEENVYSKRVAELIGTIVHALLMIFNLLIAFKIVGFDVGILMAGVAFGIGFAMESTLGNMVSAVLLVTNPKIKTEESIALKGSLNLVGKIEKITARYSIIRTLNGTRTIIPNKTMVETPIQTISQEPIVVHNIPVTIALEGDIDLAKKAIIAGINEHKDVIYKDKTFVIVGPVDEKGIVLIVYFSTFPKGQSRTLPNLYSDMRRTIVKVLKRENICIPYPHQVLLIKKG